MDTPVHGISSPYGIDCKFNFSKRIKFHYSVLIEKESLRNIHSFKNKYNFESISNESKYLNSRISLLFKINDHSEKCTYFSFGTIHSYLLNTSYSYHYMYSYPSPSIKTDSLYTYNSRRFQLHKWTIIMAISRETIIKNSMISIFREINYSIVPTKTFQSAIPTFEMGKLGVMIGIAYNFGVTKSKKNQTTE